MFSSANLKVQTFDGHNFWLLEPFTFTRPNGEVITVPVGAESDGASTPPEIWSFLPPFGTYWKAAYLHDFLYRHTKRPKAECDEILKEAMESLGVNPVTRQTIYEGVCLGGHNSFEEDRENQLWSV